jgi:hypothetical protein
MLTLKQEIEIEKRVINRILTFLEAGVLTYDRAKLVAQPHIDKFNLLYREVEVELNKKHKTYRKTMVDFVGLRRSGGFKV